MWEEKFPVSFYSHLEQMRGNPAETYNRSMISSGFHTKGRGDANEVQIRPKEKWGAIPLSDPAMAALSTRGGTFDKTRRENLTALGRFGLGVKIGRSGEEKLAIVDRGNVSIPMEDPGEYTGKGRCLQSPRMTVTGIRTGSRESRTSRSSTPATCFLFWEKKTDV